jgi:hypothetical protein
MTIHNGTKIVESDDCSSRPRPVPKCSPATADLSAAGQSCGAHRTCFRVPSSTNNSCKASNTTWRALSLLFSVIATEVVPIRVVQKTNKAKLPRTPTGTRTTIVLDLHLENAYFRIGRLFDSNSSVTDRIESAIWAHFHKMRKSLLLCRPESQIFTLSFAAISTLIRIV